MYPLGRELAADGIPVAVSCRVLGLARQPYYRWVAQPITDGQLAEAWLANSILDAHADDPEFGYRFLADEVRREGAVVSDRVVWRICRDHAWWSRFGKPKTRSKKARVHAPAFEDLVRRDFTAQGPNEKWVAGITEHPTAEGKLYLCAIKDLWSNRIVGGSIDERMKARLVVAAIEVAVARRGEVAGCILHADRGSQFRARTAHRALARHRMVGSMGQVASAADNAAMESSLALLQKNVLNRRRSWATRQELRIEIVTWIERTYHRRRRQSALGRLTPIEYETIMTPQTATAA